MKAYIYFIINQITKERYVGQTTNFSRRKAEHLNKLKDNTHLNPKLQSSVNKYGIENFIFEKIIFEDISKEELNQQEIHFINLFNSFNNGFNLTTGGTGGNTRSKLNFDQFCFAYFGNKAFDGMTNQTAQYLDCDSSTISTIKREQGYDEFRQRANLLPIKTQEAFLSQFKQIFLLDIYKPWTKQKTLDNDITLKIMCVVSSFGRGIEQTIIQHFHLSKGFIFHLMTGNGRIEVKTQYSQLTQNEIEEIGHKYFQEWNLQQYTKLSIKPIYQNLFDRY